MIELIEDIESERKLIEKTIKAYGNDPEQNYGYFLAHSTGVNKGVFIYNGKYGIQTTFDEKTRKWVMIGTPIAPEGEQIRFLNEALDFISKNGKLRKFVAEFETEKRKRAVEVIGKRYSVHLPNCVLYWPVYDMRTWNGDRLEGGEWKKIRNLINRLKRFHKVRVVDSAKVGKDKVKQVILDWVKLRNQNSFGINRKDSNRTDYGHYLKLVDLGFVGCNFAKTVLLDEKPVSLTVGWEIPNRNGAYYSGIGVYDLSIPDLGVYVNWSDLVMLKKAGYKEVDFGGSPKPLLQFKEKFKPSRTYTTHIFSITKS